MVDLRTLLAAMLVANLILAAALWIGSGRRAGKDLALWSLALLAQALAFGLFATPDGSAAAVVLGVTLLALSLTLQAAALLAFDRRHLPSWVHTAVVAGIAAPFALLLPDAGASTLFGGIVFAALLAMLAVIAWQMRSPASPQSRGLLVGSFTLGAAAFALRGLGAQFAPDPAQGFLAPSQFQSVTYLVLYAIVLTSSVGFLMLHKDRADAAALRFARIDALTGTYNRRTFNEIAERELSRARRAGQPFSIIMLDIDHFRAINERHGHRFGDEVLCRFAEVARSALRKEDMVVRYGGEEFLVMLPEVPGPGAVVVAGRIRRFVAAEPFEIGGERLAVTVSAGVSARLDEGPESIDDLVERAETALALAKKRGRNRVVALSLGRSIAA